jgi:hypothetical protein
VATGINFGNRAVGGGGGGTGLIVTSFESGGPPIVTIRENPPSTQSRQLTAYSPAFRGGVRVAVGNFNGDATPDIVTAPGPGGGPHVRVFDGNSLTEIFGFMAYDSRFTGGVYVAVGDVNGDGISDVITGAGPGGGPHVRVFSGANGQPIRSLFAYDPAFRGGVTVAAGDMNGDGRADIITGAGSGGGPHVRAFSGTNLAPLASFFAYDPAFRGGVFVAAGDVNGDARADIITGPGLGGGPHVRAFSGTDGLELASVLAFSSFNGLLIGPWASGIRVASTDYNGDGFDDFVVSAGRGRGPQVRVINGQTLGLLAEFNATSPSFLGGVYVGGL